VSDAASLIVSAVIVGVAAVVWHVFTHLTDHGRVNSS
jgi:hypothetical protein